MHFYTTRTYVLSRHRNKAINGQARCAFTDSLCQPCQAMKSHNEAWGAIGGINGVAQGARG